MGSIRFTIDSGVTARDEVLAYVRSNIEHGTVIDHSFASAGGYEWGGVMFAAVTNTDDHPHEPGLTWAAVVLFGVNNDRAHRSLAVKFLDETVGPNEVNMPLRILRRLSPTEHKYAVDWRREVERFHARRREARTTVGRTITLSSPLTFGEPVGTITQVTVESLTLWVDPISRRRLRPPAHWWQRDFTVETTLAT